MAAKFGYRPDPAYRCVADAERDVAACFMEPFNREEKTHRAGVFLLMAVGRGNSYMRVAFAANMEKHECREFKKIAVEQGIFVGRKVFSELGHEKYGWLSLVLASMALCGYVERR